MLVNHVAPLDKKLESDIKLDSFFQAIRGKTPSEINTYFDNNLGPLYQLDDTQIDNHIDTEFASLSVAQRGVLKALAKDTAFNSRTIKSLAKGLIVVANKINI